MKGAYLDHASATPVRKEVFEAMVPYFSEQFANPSNIYDFSSKVKEALEEARNNVACLIGADPAKIVFTSSGAEANNLAVKGVAFAKQKKGNHIIVSAIEHHSVLNSARFLERLNFETTFLPVDENGLVNLERLANSIRPETILVSIMHANTEIGTIEPISEAATICREKDVVLHTDAVASVGNIAVDVNELNVDLLSLSGASLGASKALKTSPVLVAIGIRADLAQGSIVFTLNGHSTEEEIDYVLEKLPGVVDRLRALSPIWGKEIPEYETEAFEN